MASKYSVDMAEWDMSPSFQVLKLEGVELESVEFGYDNGRIWLNLNGVTVDLNQGSSDFSIAIRKHNDS